MSSKQKKGNEYTPPDYYGKGFRQLISSLLQRGKLKKSTIKAILETSLEKFIQAFTHPSVTELAEYDEDTPDYEQLELGGDSLVYSTVIQYLKARLPVCDSAAGVRILTRIKIDWVSKQFLCDIADKLGFWPYINATQEIRDTKRKDLLEDVFEATIQAMYESVLLYKMQKDLAKGARSAGQRSEPGLSYSVVCRLIWSIYDKIEICGNLPDTLNTDLESLHNGCMQQTTPLKYTMLVDAKTRLKEVFDNKKLARKFMPIPGKRNGQVLGEECEQQIQCTCASCKAGTTDHKLTSCVYYVIKHDRKTGRDVKIFLRRKKSFQAIKSLKKDAQQVAAEEALQTLAKKGIVGFMPVSYAMFCPPEKTAHHRSRWEEGVSHISFWKNDSANTNDDPWESLDEQTQKLKLRSYRKKCCRCKFPNCQSKQ